MIQSLASTIPEYNRTDFMNAAQGLRSALLAPQMNGQPVDQATFDARRGPLAANSGMSGDAQQQAFGRQTVADTGGALQGLTQNMATGQTSLTGPAVGKTMTPGEAAEPVQITMPDGSTRTMTKGQAQAFLGAGGGTAQPGVPAQPGITGPSVINKQYLTQRGGDMADYQKNLDSNTKTGGLIMQTLQEGQDALAKFKPGGGASTYAEVGKIAQALGAPQDLVDRISNGDLGASQEFQKLMVNTTMGQIREQLQGVGASRLSQMEFAAFNQNNPNIDTDPRAVQKIFNFWTKLYNRDHAEQQELNKYVSGGGDISQWPSKWQDIAQERGYINPGAGAGPTKQWKIVDGKLVPQ